MVIYNPDATIFVPEDDAWTALINPCPFITPNYCYAADKLVVKLGATNKGSSFKYSFEDYDWWRNALTFGDLIETWIGVQYGTDETPWDGTSGRKWLCGGFNELRYTEVDKTGKKTFWIEGYDYTAYMQYLMWGKPNDVKEYANTLIGAIVDAMGTYLVSLGFTKAQGAATPADYFDSTVTPRVDRTYDKFNQISDIIKDLCNEANPITDWYLRPYLRNDTGAKMRGIFFHDRTTRSSGMTVDWSNFRGGKLVWGDSRNLLTDIFVTNSENVIIGAKWCDSKSGWSKPALPSWGQKLDILDYRSETVDVGTGLPVVEDKVWCAEKQAPAICSFATLFTMNTYDDLRYGWYYWIEIDISQYTHFNFWYRAIGTIGDHLVRITHGLPVGNHFIWQEITPPNTDWNRYSYKLPTLNPDGSMDKLNGWTAQDIPPGMPGGDYTSTKTLQFRRTQPKEQYMCVAGLEFARMIYENSSSGLYSFPRYGVISDPVIATPGEAIEKSQAALALLQEPLVYCNPTVDGDPNYLPAMTLSLDLVAPFLSVTRVIDEAKHTVTDKSDYYAELTLSKIDERPPPTTENDMAAFAKRVARAVAGLGNKGQMRYK